MRTHYAVLNNEFYISVSAVWNDRKQKLQFSKFEYATGNCTTLMSDESISLASFTTICRSKLFRFYLENWLVKRSSPAPSKQYKSCMRVVMWIESYSSTLVKIWTSEMISTPSMLSGRYGKAYNLGRITVCWPFLLISLWPECGVFCQWRNLTNQHQKILSTLKIHEHLVYMFVL